MTFHPLSDSDLQCLSDDDLIAYVRSARGAGELAAGRRALALLVYGYERDVRRRLSMRLPAHVVEDVAHDALVRAIAAAFDGRSQGEFRGWLNTIVDRAAVDFFRRAGRRPREVRLPSEHLDDDDSWGEEPFTESATGAVELGIIVQQILEGYSNKHREVIELHVFDGWPAAEACSKIEGMSADNVAQIASRFRANLRERLDPGSRAKT